MTTVQIRTHHEGGKQVRRTVSEAHAAGIEITPATALTIASWWQSPGKVGHVLAAFASGWVVGRSALLDDIHATRLAEGYHNGRMSDDDRLALDMLATFVIQYP